LRQRIIGAIRPADFAPNPTLLLPMTIKARDACSIALALLSLGIVAWIDYITGSEISVYALYAFPIAWVVWSMNLAWGVVLSVLASAAWLWADFADGTTYPHGWIRWERGGMNLVVFAFIAFSFDHFKSNLARKNRQVKVLEGILPVCISCNRISDAQGHWTDLDTYLRAHSNAQPESRLCPDCAGSRYR
jgi:hypothetical protein